MERSALELADLHLESLYPDNDAGAARMRVAGDAAPRPTPRFHLFRTPEGNRWRVRDDLSDKLSARLDELAAAESVAPIVEGEPANASAIRELLTAHTPIGREYSGPAFVVPETLPDPGEIMEIDASNLGLFERYLHEWARDFSESDRPLMAVVEGGDAVSVCSSATALRRAVEAGVETAEAWRGRGLASRVVTAWVRAVAATGCLPLYSTTWDNVASRGVARRLGMRMYGADWHVS